MINKLKLPENIRKRRYVKLKDGNGGNVDGEDILYCVQQIHSSLGHAGASITYQHALDWMSCSGLKSICEYACRNCICELIKPNVGGAAYVGSLSNLAKSANDVIYIDTWDAGVASTLDGYINVRKCQTRIDGKTGRIGGSILHINDSSHHWEAFKHNHIDKFGRPRIIYSDQSKSEFGSVFDENCTRLGIHHNLSAVARGQSNSIIERVHRELAICIFSELAERGMRSDEWPRVFQVCIDKLNRRSHINGKPSAFEFINGGKPYFSSIDFIRNIIKDPMPKNVPIFKQNEEVLFYNPNRKRAKIEERFETAIVEKQLTPHTILLRASDSNKYRLPTYRVIAHPGQIKRMIDININPFISNSNGSKPRNLDSESIEKVNEENSLDEINVEDLHINLEDIKEDKFIIWRVNEQEKLCVGKIDSVEKDKNMCVVHYFGTYSNSSNLGERIFRPSWQSPQGWCVFSV